MKQSWWIEDIWAIQITTKSQRLLAAGSFLVLFLFAHENIPLFVDLFQYFAVVLFGNEFISWVSRRGLLSFQKCEWARFIYNLATYNHLLTLGRSDHFLLALVAIYSLLYSIPLASGRRASLLVGFSFLTSYWISMVFLAIEKTQSTMHLENSLAVLSIFVGVEVLRQVLELERARVYLLHRKLQELEKPDQKPKPDDKAA